MKTNKEQYEAPVCNVVEMETQQIICTSNNNLNSTHDGFINETEDYQW